MLLLGFLTGTTGLILILGFLVQFKTYRKSLRAVLLALSGLFTAYVWIAYVAVLAVGEAVWFQLHILLMALDVVIALLMVSLARNFLRAGGGADGDEPAWKLGRMRVSLFGLAAAAAVGLLVFLPDGIRPAWISGENVIRFHGLSRLIPVVNVLLAIYTLYLLESTYRFAQDYQRRIGRLCFIGQGVLAVFHVTAFARALLYGNLPPHFAEASSVLYGVVFPVVLAGFLRYRLGSERIAIPRDTMYTSATVFLTGAVFFGVALTIFAFRWLDLDFTYFEHFLLGFSLCFLAVLVLGSGTMRRHISRFINHQFYSRKYDYQEQFFRLHKTATSGADVDGAMTELVENMKYSVNVDDAYFFILNWQDGNLYQHENKEESTLRGLVVSGDSPLARTLSRDNTPVDLLARDEANLARRRAALQEPLVVQLGIDAAFPIFIGERLAGILALVGGRAQPFDSEDLDLIDVFTNSIGDALFKNRVLKERIEQKQFESFHHVASFIIHDIKNQIATLSLLLKNAERNLGNPSFQASMMSSLKSCVVNLQSLIDRLSVAPRSHELELSLHPLRPLLEEVAANSGLDSLTGIDYRMDGADGDDGVAGAAAPMDRQALFFVVRNLVTNALEAMRDGGRLTLGYGPLGAAIPARLRELFGGGERFFSSYGAYILVEDSGAGMDKEFVRRRLFQPFATTKEKGVGIGLYQCKTLVEKMGGRILCHSELGSGTEFCILLPAAPAGSGG